MQATGHKKVGYLVLLDSEEFKNQTTTLNSFMGNFLFLIGFLEKRIVILCQAFFFFPPEM